MNVLSGVNSYDFVPALVFQNVVRLVRTMYASIDMNGGLGRPSCRLYLAVRIAILHLKILT